VPPEPAALLGVLVIGGLYARGVFVLWQRSGHAHGVRLWQAVCCGGGLLAIVIALETPLDRLSEELFAFHMTQHLLLILAAGPLLVLGAPVAPLLWALPEGYRRTVGSWFRTTAALLTNVPVAFALHSLTLWLWHLPFLYEAALKSRGVHILEHLTFLGTAVLFWWAIVHASRAVGLLSVFGLALQSTLLGALLAFSPTPWYTTHLTSARAWGLTPGEDQQLAGLIMWVPGSSVYLAAALGLLAAWFRDSSKASASSS
jgi:cytochrome c oxidase assembly factor CtaG